MDKLKFLLQDYIPTLRKLDSETSRLWGKMNVQQMIEHMSDAVREANGKTPRTVMTPPERLATMKDFLMSDKEFRPDTKNAMMGSEPLPARNKSKEEAINELENELADFEVHFKNNPSSIITNPFFGDLNYVEWTQLLHKHAVHHLKQFGAGAF